MTFDNVNRAIGERNLPKSVLRAQSYSFAYYSSSALEALLHKMRRSKTDFLMENALRKRRHQAYPQRRSSNAELALLLLRNDEASVPHVVSDHRTSLTINQLRKNKFCYVGKDVFYGILSRLS